MKGSNELHLNEASVIEALQNYLTDMMNNFAPKVVGVRWDGDTFIVRLVSEDTTTTD